MAKEDHLIKFQVQNFKRFKNLSLENLGQFNLIVGDNNVGKTSVLEALLYDDQLDKFSMNLYKALSYKNLGGEYKEGHFSFFVNKASLLESSEDVRVEYFCQKAKNKNSDWGMGDTFLFKRNGNLVRINEVFEEDRTLEALRDNKHEILEPISLIPFSVSYGKELMDIYSKTFIRDRAAKKQLINILSPLIPSIEDLEMDTAITDYPVLVVAKKGIDFVVPLVSYGDGTVKLFRLLMFLILFRGQRLMIDEIDTGIHYSRMKDFWRTILKAAEENEVQLFVTTHNQECIRYFKEVLEENGMEHLQKEARTITLVENVKSKDIEAFTSGFEELDYSLTVGNEIR